MQILKNKINRKFVLCGIYALFFILLALAVSLCAIWIKYKVMDFEVSLVEPEKREYSIYYNSLSYKEQLLYNCIYDAANEISPESEILSYSYDMEEFQRVLDCIRGDRPELFYVDYDALVLYHSNHRTKVGMVYLEAAQNIPDMIRLYEDAVNRATQNLLPSMTDFEKEVAVNDYLADNCRYPLGEGDKLSNTAYGALVLKTAYCDGYAYAAKQLFNEAYIDSVVVYGKADDAEHVWNMVEIEGHFYHLDIMWNDADAGNESKLRFHGYFNLSDDTIGLDHIYDDRGFLPNAVVDSNYYRQTGCYAATVNEIENVLYNQLMSAVGEKREFIELLCPETKSSDTIGPLYLSALGRVNSELGEDILYGAYSIFDASSHNNSITIQIFYN